MSSRKKRLAKDLDLLIGAARTPTSAGQPEASSPDDQKVSGSANDSLRKLPLDQLQRGKYQPRREFDQASLEELAESIRSEGVMQPIVVRPVGDQRWEIIAGERRWRASQLAGVDRIPAVIREVSDESAIAMALIENIQRENLNAIEEAQALKRLQVEFELSQQQVADRVGKSRSMIANLLRLLSLEPDVRDLIETGQLDTGHGKVLLALEDITQIKAAKQVVAGRLSVRQTEALVKGLLQPAPETSSRIDPDIARLEQDLAGRLGAAVAINHSGKGRGKLVINYGSLDELDGILSRIR